MRALLLLVALLFLPAVGLRGAEVAVVYAVDAVSAGERGFARALAGHVRRWYAEAGVEADLVADSAFRGGDGHGVAVLVDCYTPNAAFLAQVRRGMEAGTRFVVCYSGSAGLARLFGLEPVGYKKDGPRRSMAFLPNRPKGAPETIAQTSENRFEVRPAKGSGAAPMAWWVDVRGRRAGVAWWRTAGGHYWMTHVLTGDGDEEGKRRLLLAIAAERSPGVWAAAGRRILAEASAPLRDGTLRERIRRFPRGSEQRARLERAARLLEAQREAAEAALEAGGIGAYQAALDLRDLAARVYAQTFTARRGETRGVWDHSGMGLWPGDWERTARTLAAAGITDVYVNVAGAAFALYPSQVLARKGEADCLA